MASAASPVSDPILLVLVVLGLLPAAAFGVIYAVSVKWYRTEGGRHLMAFAWTMTVLCLWALVGLLFPGHAGRDLFTVVVAVLLNLLLWWRLTTLIRYRFGAKARQDPDRGRSSDGFSRR